MRCIEQLLSMARADSGRETLHLQPVDLRDTLHGVVDGWQQVASLRNLKFSGTWHLQSSQRPTPIRRCGHSRPGSHESQGCGVWRSPLLSIVICDGRRNHPPQIGGHSARQCLQVHARARLGALSLRSTGEIACITVQDSGVGIASEDQSKFRTLLPRRKARSRSQGGAGLGLAIAQWIVNQHLGSIAVDSRPGQGARFRVELPMIAAPIRNPQPALTYPRCRNGNSMNRFRIIQCRRHEHIQNFQPLPYNCCHSIEMPSQAGMAELADAADSKSADLRVLGVRFPLPAPHKNPVNTRPASPALCVRLPSAADAADILFYHSKS